MPKIGDKLKLTIRGPVNLAGTVLRDGDNVTFDGEIVEERGDNWVVRINGSLGGKNLVLLPKSAKAKEKDLVQA